MYKVWRENYTEIAYSGHLGVSIDIPLSGLSGFIEYKLLATQFNVNIDMPKTTNNIKIKTGVLNHNVVFGLKYSFL